MRPNRSGAATASVPVGVAFRLAEVGHDRAGAVEKALARLGQADRPRGPLQQPGAQVLFKACDLTRDHRRRYAQPAGRRRESAGVANGDERCDGVEPIHIIAISATISCRQRTL
jgi:hypothetical protein